MTVVACVIFVITWALIANRELRWLPIGRAAGALLGAALMVLCGVMSPDDAYRAIDARTIGLLFGMMVITAFLAEARVLERVGAELVSRARSPRGMLVAVALASGVLSALLVNDTICLFATPVVVLACRRARLPALPYLMAIATSSNIGSVGTLVGNPQVMIIGSQSRIAFSTYLAHMGPLALALLGLNTLLLLVWYGPALPRAMPGAQDVAAPAPVVPVDSRRVWPVVIVIVAVFAAFLAGADLSWVAMAGGVALMVLARRDPTPVFARVDWKLLVFFAGLFVVVKGVDTTGLPAKLLTSLHGTAWYIPALLVGSNLFSNVPMVVLAAPSILALPAAAQPVEWYSLALVTTLAGNLTLIGSAANLIVAEQAELPFWTHLRFGLVSTLLTTVVGVAWLHA